MVPTINKNQSYKFRLGVLALVHISYLHHKDLISLAKVWKIVGFSAIVWVLVLLALSLFWYKANFKGYFTFFDDSLEWLQMDKAIHSFAAFQMSRFFIQILIWQGVEEEQAKRVGVWSGVFFVSPIEILDGVSQGYGFSWYDILANVLGSAFLWIQFKLFGLVKFMPKFSFSPTDFSGMRKEMLGSSLMSQLFKDYNGQTYWICFSPNIFLRKPIFPDWLSLAIGYGGENLLGGHDNVWRQEDKEFDLSALHRYRQFYLSLDLNFQNMVEDKPWKRGLKFIVSCIKFPFPSIVYSTERGLYINWLGF